MKYLTWLRTRNCVVSGKKAQCAHHIRLGTNGGTSLKPSDYFCIPLINEFHTTGPNALHIIGEETFLNFFSLTPLKLFTINLRDYLHETYDLNYTLDNDYSETVIAELIELIESRVNRSQSRIQVKKKAKKSPTPKESITESEYYQRAKKLKNERDRELRKKLKEESKNEPSPKKQFKGNEYYEKAKEAKRIKDRELRREIKERTKKNSKLDH